MLGTLVRNTGDLVLGRLNARLAHCRRVGVWVYALALTSAAGSAIAFGSRLAAVGAALLLVHGFFDYLDGGLRRARGQGDVRPRWLGIDLHTAVDKASEVLVFAGIASGGGVGWPLAVAAALTSCAVTLVGRVARRRLGIDLDRTVFDRSDRLFVLVVAAVCCAFRVALALVCAMNGVILLQRLAGAVRAGGRHRRTS